MVPSVGVENSFSETQRRENRAARKGKWSPRGTGTIVLHFCWKCARATGKAVENGQNSGEVGRCAHPGQDRRLPSVATHSRLLRATSVRSRVGIVLEDDSGVAIDWVTGRSYPSARRRLNVQSGQRKGGKCAAAPYPSVAVRDRGPEKVLRKRMGP